MALTQKLAALFANRAAWLVFFVAGIALGMFILPAAGGPVGGPPRSHPIEVEPAPTLTDAQKAEGIRLAVESAEARGRLGPRAFKTAAGAWTLYDGPKLVRSGVAVTFYVQADDGKFYQDFLLGVDLATGEVTAYELDKTKPMPPE